MQMFSLLCHARYACTVQALGWEWSASRETIMSADNLSALSTNRRGSSNKGRIVGQKRPLKPKDVWAIRIRLQNLSEQVEL